ncbi:LA_3334 family protein [Leptospira yasudae]|uniref:Uncharacterized protein n=1 Tax=Leptospira yasudae TaxID=2202201 RepID=A0ABX9M0H5_9LEPT|nr:hypothetical protein [Leptospira yasudae]RHX78485.1 hypothetical protein DLM77_15390 [Leptospira yasudae]
MKFRYFPASLLLAILVLCNTEIFAVEIVFQNGESFVATEIEENDAKIKVVWKGDEYEIPKSDIVSIDKNKRGADFSYRYTTLKLHGGSVLVGVVVEEQEDVFVIKTNLGFMNVEKSKLREPIALNSESPKIHKKYLTRQGRVWNNRFGLSGSIFANTNPIASSNPISSGGSFFIEPSALDFSGFRISYRADYYQSISANSKFQFFNQFVYVNKSKQFFENPILNFYFNFGIGASMTSFSGNGERRNGINPAAMFSLGWQGFSFGSFQGRVGFNSFCNFERDGSFCAVGLEIGVMYLL